MIRKWVTTVAATITYESLVYPHLNDLHQYCIRLAGSTWDGEDLYQEVLLKTFKYYRNEGTIRNARPFLFRTARNLWIDQYRMRKNQNMVVGLESVFTCSIPSVDYVEICSLVEGIAEKLNERHMDMLLLSEYFGYSMQEIAEYQNTTVSAVKSVLYRARETIRKDKRPFRIGDPHVIRVPVERWARAVMLNQPQVLYQSG